MTDLEPSSYHTDLQLLFITKLQSIIIHGEQLSFIRIPKILLWRSFPDFTIISIFLSSIPSKTVDVRHISNNFDLRWCLSENSVGFRHHTSLRNYFCATEIFMIKYFGASKGKCYTVISLYNSSIDPITAEPSYCSSSGVSSVFPFGYMLPNSITCDVSNSEVLLGTNSFNLDDHDDIYYRCTHNCAIFAWFPIYVKQSKALSRSKSRVGQKGEMSI